MQLVLASGWSDEHAIVTSDLLDGHVALVTGGGTNLTRAAAAELVRNGAEVVVVGTDEQQLDALGDELGERCSSVCCDVRARAGCERAVELALARHGHVDSLLNNAGGPIDGPPRGEHGWGQVERDNVDGTVQMTEVVVERAFEPGGRGVIASVTATIAGERAGLAQIASGAAVVGRLTREWAERWAGERITAVTVSLGEAEPPARPAPAAQRPHETSSIVADPVAAATALGWLPALVGSPLGRSMSGRTITLDGSVTEWWGPMRAAQPAREPSPR